MTSREQFEAWAKTTNSDLGRYKTGIHKGDFKNPVMRKMWLAWQASRSSIELNLTSEWDISSDGSRHYDADYVDEQLLALGIKVKK